jgi:XTP/dITP diphosphohydrolase
MQILLATTNQGKILELEQILGSHSIEVKGPGRLAAPEGLESGSTFAENALLKARYFHNQSGLVTIADDSGLEVAALGGRPGIYSARYAGPAATDDERITKLLNELKDVPVASREARFVCAAAICWEGGERVFEDEARGVILKEPRGRNGFGYDPVFYYPPLAKTFAELAPEEKARISHRGLAFLRLVGWLNESQLLDTLSQGDKIVNPTGKTSASSE